VLILFNLWLAFLSAAVWSPRRPISTALRYQLIATATYLAKPRFAPLGCGPSATGCVVKFPDLSIAAHKQHPSREDRVFCFSGLHSMLPSVKDGWLPLSLIRPADAEGP
jgi:hypothetical protein